MLLRNNLTELKKQQDAGRGALNALVHVHVPRSGHPWIWKVNTPGYPIPNQRVYHARTQVWKTPPFRGYWTKKNPTHFSSEIADFEAQ